MDELIIDELRPEHRTGPTGPRTPDGKAKSSQNSLKHGCRSEKTVLPDEDPAEFEATVQAWFDHYRPDTQPAVSLVEQLALAHWKLKRNTKRLEEIEYQLPGNAHLWTEEHQKRYATFTRYHTTAERSFLRYYKEVEAHYHRILRDDQARELAFAKLASVEFKRLDESDAAALDQLRFTQAVEVGIADGIARTYGYPSNQEVLDAAASQPTPPVYLSRSILFPDGVPPEYAWAKPAPTRPGQVPKVVQRILWPQWIELIARERSTGTGHAGPLYTPKSP